MYRDLIKLVQPTLTFARLCCVCPSPLIGSYVPGSNILYSILLCLYILTINLLNIVDKLNKFKNSSNFMSLTFDMVSLGLCLCLVLAPYFRKPSLVEFFDNMEAAQESLHKLNIRQPPEPTKKSQLLWLIFVSHIFLIDVVNVLSFQINWLDSVSHWIVSLVSVGFFSRARVLLGLVRCKMDLLNWHLDDLNNRWPLFLPRPPDVTFSEFTSVASWRSTHFLRYDRHVRDVTPEKVLTFNRAHFYLYCAYRKLNKSLSLELLVFTLFVSVCNITMSSMVLLELMVGDILMKFFVLYHLLFTFFVFTTLLTYTSKIKDQSRKTALLVHDLLDEEGHSPQVVAELEQFSKMLLHRDMSCTAAGFFNFDLKLVSRMALSLAPVIIFAVQRGNRP